MRNIVVISECNKATEILNSIKNDSYNVNVETQINDQINNKITEEEIRQCDALLFVIENTVEEIQDIERFIEIEYYEVQPSHILNDAKAVIQEILNDIN